MKYTPFAEQPESESVVQQFSIADYLHPELVQRKYTIASQKRLFKAFATQISGYLNSQTHTNNKIHFFDEDEVFLSLYNRERLGSTALGKGVVLPHSRVEGMVSPVISVICMDETLEYDTPDGIPVWLAVCLLVPSQLNGLHLSILARLTEKFSDDTFLHSLKKTRDSKQIYELFIR